MAADDHINQLEVLLEIRARVKRMEENFSSAFVKDDNGEPDFVGHRQFHRLKIDEARAAGAVREDVTKKVVSWMSIAGLTVIGYALLDWIKAHLK